MLVVEIMYFQVYITLVCCATSKAKYGQNLSSKYTHARVALKHHVLKQDG